MRPTTPITQRRSRASETAQWSLVRNCVDEGSEVTGRCVVSHGIDLWCWYSVGSCCTLTMRDYSLGYCMRGGTAPLR